MRRVLLIVDGHAILHRAYHALPPLTAPDGRLVNAVYGFLTVFFKALADLQPTHVAVVFDRPEETFRKKLFAEYQAQREEKPDELYAQIPIIQELLRGMRVPVFEVAGFEADDVIGTIVARVRDAREQKNRRTKEQENQRPNVIILTGDKDLLQLVREGIEAVLLRRGMTDTTRYDTAGVLERFGFPPERIPDYKALAGDPSDNYPGVPGIGEKTATELVKAFGGVSDILKNAKRNNAQNAKLPAPLTEKLAKKICDHAADLDLGITLSTIVRDVPIAFRLAACARESYDRDAVVARLRALGFASLVGRLPAVEQPDDRVQPNAPVRVSDGEVLADAEAIRAAVADARGAGAVALAVIARGDDVRHGHPLALGLAFGDRSVGCTPWGTALAESAGLLRDGEIPKDAHDAKSVLHALRRSRIDLGGLRYDTALLSYLLAPGSRSHDLAHVAFAELGIEPPAARQQAELLPPAERKEERAPDDERRSAAERAGSEAAIVQRLVPILVRKATEADLLRVYEEFERPLIPVLQRMEECGVRLDCDHLVTLGKRMRKDLAAADRALFRHAGHEFNIDSPAQLKTVLFEELGLAVRGIKKTAKGGVLSTAAAELEKLRDAHPIVAHILAHRELQKLLSTYVAALPTLVDPVTGRVHTTYHQTVAATGRLSSSDPNLQNIPVTEPWGPEIRRAFAAEDGWRLLALDYSQFELRVAASLSGDRMMTSAFRLKQDFHAATAAEVFGVEPDDVTRDQRRVAKAINFGILYGMGASALAASAGISRAEADEYIQRYFAAYPELAAWVEETKALAAKRGYVETLFGRKRFLPEITSGVPQVRAAAERMAVNMPVQGTQADLLKRAMIRADAWIQEMPSRSGSIRMVLTVHDELVFEVREEFIAEATSALRDILEHVHKLPVPIVVEAKAGRNWAEMERIPCARADRT